jgi:16S rRNA A1518/A1519 N6-dimethyltransferase RsmA/KsgA/DIM1 with predicted DNA glycosylase/AP lyase activity
MNQTLTTNTYYGSVPPQPVSPPPPVAPSITMPEPTSYEFQVVEHVEDGKITKVALQVRRHTHDQYGSVKIFGTWEDVPRVRIGDVASVV